jgi:hypothetical protein
LRTAPLPGGRLRTDYRLTVPAQSPAFEGRIRFAVEGTGVISQGTCETPVRVPAVVVQATADPIEVPRYPGWQETAFGWLRPRVSRVPVVRLEGVGADEAGCTWSVADEAAGPADRVPVSLTSRYRHTVFRPGDGFEVPVREVETPVPWAVWAVFAAGTGLLALAVTRPWPLKITLDSGHVVRAWGSLRLDREFDHPGLRLRLRRSLLGGLWLSRRDRVGCRVFVVAPESGRREVTRGRPVRVAPGDRVEVEPEAGAPGASGLTVGGWDAEPGRAASAGFDAEDGFRETEGRWLV